MSTFIYGNYFDLTSDMYSDKIAIGIMSPDKRVIEFTIGTTQPFEEMFDVYCARQCVNRRNLQFSYKGTPLRASQLPMGLKNGAKIDAVLVS